MTPVPGCKCVFKQIFFAAFLFVDVVFVFLLQSNGLFSVLKLVICAGPSTSSRKVAEYGGNTLGYGSRSVLGAGWPKDLVKVGYPVTSTSRTGPGSECNAREFLVQGGTILPGLWAPSSSEWPYFP